MSLPGVVAIVATDSSPAPKQPSSPPATKAERAYRAFSMSAVGLEMGVCVLIGWAIGHYAIDGYFDTAPYGTLGFLGFGVAAGFKALFRAARQAKQVAGESNQ